MTTAPGALDRLREGNRRFASGVGTVDALSPLERRREFIANQAPFAVVLGCSDSRVPPETIFDQGLGDLFVVRVAGNVAAPTQIGSIEFAAEQLGVRMVVVLGHSGCGAVSATLDELERPTEDVSPGLQSIIDRIRPAFVESRGAGFSRDREDILSAATRANVRATAQHLSRDSPSLSRLIEPGGLEVVGAVYSLETGLVEFLDDATESA